PMAFSAGLSLFRWDGLSDPRFVGLKNYLGFLVDDSILRDLFLQSLGNNIKLAIFVTLGVVVISVPLAVAMNTVSKRTRGVVRTSLLLPMVTAGIAVFYAWTALLGPRGPVVTAFRFFGIDWLAPHGGWLSDPTLALPGLIAVMIWSGVPYATLLYLSGLQSIDGTLYEAASIDGAGPIRQLVSITLPLLNPITLIVVVLNLVYAMQSYEMIYLITNGGPSYSTNTVGLLSYNLAFGTIGGNLFPAGSCAEAGGPVGQTTSVGRATHQVLVGGVDPTGRGASGA
ncbi:MAG: sugar ABC transporter permease, partial [Aquihabitans sp.]